MPRLLGTTTDWFELDLPLWGNLIRVEDLMTEREYTVRGELPGMDPERDVQITVSTWILTIHDERREETPTRHRYEFRYGMLHRSVRSRWPGFPRLPPGGRSRRRRGRRTGRATGGALLG